MSAFLRAPSELLNDTKVYNKFHKSMINKRLRFIKIN